MAADVALQAYFDRETLDKATFDERLDAELMLRGLPKRQTYAGKQTDDRWSYSRTKSIIAVTVGLVTVLIQISAILALAFYLRFWINRDQYVSYAQSLQAQAVDAANDVISN